MVTKLGDSVAASIRCMFFVFVVLLLSCVPSSEEAITSFSFPSLTATSAIDEAERTISVWVPPDTDPRALVATFESTGKRVEVSGVAQVSQETANDFSWPVIYVVTAEDGSTAAYVVTLYRNDTKSLTFFFISSPHAGGTLGPGDTVRVIVPAQTDLSALVAQFETTGKEVTVNGLRQESNVTVNDFRAPVIYRVVAMDGSTRDYIVILAADRVWQLLQPVVADGQELLNLAFDAEGIPHAVLSTAKEFGNVKRIEVRKLLGSVWEKVGEKELRGSAIGETSLSLQFDAQGTLYLAFVTWTGGNEKYNIVVHVYRLADGDWQPLGKTTLRGNRYSLALDPGGTPHLMYWWFEWNGSSEIRVLVYSDDAWQPLGKPLRRETTVDGILAFDRSGSLWAALLDRWSFSVARHDEDSWTVVGEAFESNGFSAALAFDPFDTPHIAYVDYSTKEGRKRVRVRKLVDEAWQDIGSPVPAEDDALWIQLRVDPQGMPYLAYTNEIIPVVTQGEYPGMSDYKPVVLSFQNGSWRPVGDADFLRNLVTFTLELDPSGVPHIYGDRTAYVYRLSLSQLLPRPWELPSRIGSQPTRLEALGVQY